MKIITNILIAGTLIFFLQSQKVFSQTQMGADLTSPSTGNFGKAISLDDAGTTIAIGSNAATGIVEVFFWNGSTWIQKGADILGRTNEGGFGEKISLSGDGSTLAVGVWNTSDFKGYVKVFKWNGADWAQKGTDLVGEYFAEYSGSSVSLSTDGNLLSIGSMGGGGLALPDAGHVKVYSWTNNIWKQRGSTIIGTASYDYFHIGKLSGDGNTLIVGTEANGYQKVGNVKVYSWSGTNYTQKGSTISGSQAGDNFGATMNISEDGLTLQIGSFLNDEKGENFGKVSMYKYVNNTWTKLGQDIYGGNKNDYFGKLMAMNKQADKIVIGPYLSTVNGTTVKFKLFALSNNSWTETTENITLPGTRGTSVAMNADGTRIAVGTYNLANKVSVFESIITSAKKVANSDFRFYPNPASDYLVISCEALGDIKIYNQNGALVEQIEKQGNILTVMVSHLAPGIYTIHFNDGKEVLSQKFLKL